MSLLSPRAHALQGHRTLTLRPRIAWDRLLLSPKSRAFWYWTSDTRIDSVVAANVDGDEDVEIVTRGHYNDFSRDAAQLVVWDRTILAVDYLTA